MLRLYFIWKASPIEPLSFSTKELMSRPYQVVSTLYNLHLYFRQNSRYDNFEDTAIQWPISENLLTAPDVWLLSRLQKLVKKTTEGNHSCRFHEAARALDDYIINGLSQVYIPITRAELWNEDESNKQRRLAIYAILHHVLRTLDILMHPLCPFTTEYLYQSTFHGMKSILLESWPKHDDALINDAMEESFDIMKDIVSVSAAARMKGKLKRRWPLTEALVCVSPGKKKKLEPLSGLLRAQLNVEKSTIHEVGAADGLDRIAEMHGLGIPITPVITLERKKGRAQGKAAHDGTSKNLFRDGSQGYHCGPAEGYNI